FMKPAHPADPGMALRRAAIFVYDPANRLMVVTQKRHHVFRVGAFREAGKAAQIAEQRGNFSTMAFELPLCSGGYDQIGYLRRKETAQSAHALNFAHLVRNTLF